ncbi:hypothetical protein GT204_07840 [Streptomyces sp. SID4919]|uniref:hypothetical protein n=1 Tax=unclassified Streptomyces TaxID=2593676 RepID=UPI000823DA4A|nr:MULTISPECIES: hypothetical protein [unclassified Streptomyces]MYY08816.1 hypothetical protein [Streptomyces sp. SID4919]SCK25508.1 hypothetical protein YW7DRAFT_01951 [Streptomyces sp. AmelKG-E11A]
MTTDQPTGPDEGPRVAHYTRRTPSAETLRDQMLDLVLQHERETIAARALAGDPNPTDSDPLEWVYTISTQWEQHRGDPDARAAHLDKLADELTLDDIRALRIAGETAQAVTPRVVLAEADHGKSVAQIAGEVGLTESRVYGALREERARRVEAAADAARAAVPSSHGPLAEFTQALAEVARLVADMPDDEPTRPAAEQALADLRAAALVPPVGEYRLSTRRTDDRP